MELGQNKFFCSGSPVGRVDDYVSLRQGFLVSAAKRRPVGCESIKSTKL